MNRIKEKLAQSVRQARCAPAAARPAKTPAKPAAKAAVEPAVKAAAPAAAARTGGIAGEPSASATTLFPQRVWPD